MGSPDSSPRPAVGDRDPSAAGGFCVFSLFLFFKKKEIINCFEVAAIRSLALALMPWLVSHHLAPGADALATCRALRVGRPGESPHSLRWSLGLEVAHGRDWCFFTYAGLWGQGGGGQRSERPEGQPLAPGQEGWGSQPSAGATVPSCLGEPQMQKGQHPSSPGLPGLWRGRGFWAGPALCLQTAGFGPPGWGWGEGPTQAPMAGGDPQRPMQPGEVLQSPVCPCVCSHTLPWLGGLSEGSPVTGMGRLLPLMALG